MGRRLPVRVLMGIIIVSMMLIVSAAAMWSEVLKANITVQSGNIDIDVDSVSVVEGYEFGKAWVADCSVNIVDSDELDTVEINIVIKNGYPGYNCTIHFTIENTGTIPVIGPFYREVEVPKGLRLAYGPDSIWQLHPGDILEHRVSVEILQNAQESTEYNITIEVGYIQWNEVSVEVKSTTISGCVFNDLDGDGVWDQGEPTLKYIPIELLENGNNLITSTYTDEDGCYSFLVYPGGVKIYTIKAYAPPGYEFTTPDTITLTVEPGKIYPDNNFGMKMKMKELVAVAKDFRETEDVDLEKCPAKLGTLLDMRDNYYIVKVEVKDGKVKSVSPGALYGVIAIEGQGIINVYVEDRYDYQFNVEDGEEDGKVRVYIFNKVTGCATELKSGRNFTYTIDNIENVAKISISLSRPLTDSEAVLMYLKFKPTNYDPVKEPKGLKEHPWATLDRYFENTVKVTTNIGYVETIALIRIDKK